MLKIDKIKSILINVISEEANAILKLKEYVNDDFVNAVKCIYQSNGRVILSGIGKSANIAQKIVATLNSTGTPSIFMHAADAIHGDLGIVQKNDIVLCISKSGNTPEIKVIVPLIKQRNNKLISITGNENSYLAKNSDFTLLSKVDKEACPNNLAPTTSTTAQLVLGDALAVALLELNNFKSNDFAKYHPGGSLGKKLYLTVENLIAENPIPKVNLNSSIKDVINEISNKRLGATVVLDKNNIIGIITDGDIRRKLNETLDLTNLFAKDLVTKNPKTILNTTLAIKALEMLETNNISQLIVVDNNNNYKGILHLHELIKEGLL